MSKHKKRFCKELHISGPTFSLMVRLGEMGSVEYENTISTYSSVNEWYRKGKPKEMSIERKNLMTSLIRSFPAEAKMIQEILRIEQPYLKEKDLEDFSHKVFYGKETPFTVFVKYYFLPSGSALKLPFWVIVGFQMALDKVESNQPVDATILAKLREVITENEIEGEHIEQAAKSLLKLEWAI